MDIWKVATSITASAAVKSVDYSSSLLASTRPCFCIKALASARIRSYASHALSAGRSSLLVHLHDEIRRKGIAKSTGVLRTTSGEKG